MQAKCKIESMDRLIENIKVYTQLSEYKITLLKNVVEKNHIKK